EGVAADHAIVVERPAVQDVLGGAQRDDAAAAGRLQVDVARVGRRVDFVGVATRQPADRGRDDPLGALAGGGRGDGQRRDGDVVERIPTAVRQAVGIAADRVAVAVGQLDGERAVPDHVVGVTTGQAADVIGPGGHVDYLLTGEQ